MPRLLTAMAGLLAALLLLGGAFRPDAAAPPPGRPAAEVGHIAPHFALPGLDGQAVDLADNRGQVVVVAFWATWCPPCAYEMVELQKLYAAGQAAVIAVNLTDTERSAAAVAHYGEARGLTMPVALDADGAVAAAYRIQAVPTSLIIDGQGVVRARVPGAMPRTTLQGLLHRAAQPLQTGGATGRLPARLLPEMLRLGPLTLPTSGLALLLGLGAAFALAGPATAGRGVPAAALHDFLTWTAAGGLVGSRLIFVFSDPALFLGQPAALLWLARGAPALGGAAAGSLLAGAAFLARPSRRGTARSLLDSAALAAAPAAILVVGALPGPAALPSTAGAALAAALLWHQARRPHPAGAAALAALLLAAVVAVAVDFLRPQAVLPGGVSPLQWVAGALGLAAYALARRLPDGQGG